MTENSTQSNGHQSAQKPLLDFWSNWIEESQEQTKLLLDSVKGVGDLAGLRHLWLDSLAKSLEGYMRTPAFLEAMRRHFDVMTHLKSNAEDVARDFARATGIPRIDDISGLFERLQTGQKGILARLAAIEDRLEALERHPKGPNEEAAPWVVG
jgi:hypothetical protein